MAKWYVGQRVRIVHPIQKKHSGHTGTIQGLFVERSVFSVLIDCEVEWDDGYRNPYTHTSRLEPILPEGAVPSEHTAEELFEKLGINVTEGETQHV